LLTEAKLNKVKNKPYVITSTSLSDNEEEQENDDDEGLYLLGNSRKSESEYQSSKGWFCCC
jgi:hypothetical protein